MTRKGLFLAGLLIATLALVAAGPQPRAAQRLDAKRIAIEESLRAGFPPTLALAVAEADRDTGDETRWTDRHRARGTIARLGRLIVQHHDRWRPALAHYRAGTEPARLPPGPRARAARAYAEAVLRRQRHYRHEAKAWVAELNGTATDWPALRPNYGKVLRLAAMAKTLRPDPAASGALDDFEPAIETRRRLARRRLDDFAPVVARRSN